MSRTFPVRFERRLFLSVLDVPILLALLFVPREDSSAGLSHWTRTFRLWPAWNVCFAHGQVYLSSGTNSLLCLRGRP